MKIIGQTKSRITFDFFFRQFNYLEAIFSPIIGGNAPKKYFSVVITGVLQKNTNY